MNLDGFTGGGAEEGARTLEGLAVSHTQQNHNNEARATEAAAEPFIAFETVQSNSRQSGNNEAHQTREDDIVPPPEDSPKASDVTSVSDHRVSEIAIRQFKTAPSIHDDHDATASSQSSTNEVRTSLDEIHKSPGTQYDKDPSEAVDIPLPDSSASEDVPLPPRKSKTKNRGGIYAWATQGKAKPVKQKKRETTKTEPRGTPIDVEVENYRRNISLLAEHFPNFGNVAATGGDTRHEWTSSTIVVHDRTLADGVHTSSRQLPFASHLTAPTFTEFKKVLRSVTDDCIQRIILIEDLSPKLIDLLGATFDIAPHVFAEHLDSSGYRKTDVETDVKTSTWDAHSTARGYFSGASVKWYRPVLPLIPISQRFRTRLIRDRKPKVDCPFDGCTRHTLPLQATANIWRQFLELCPEPGEYYRGSGTEFPVGWEERVTIWKRDFDGCEFVIVLLDPLPVVVVNKDKVQVARQARQPRLFTMGNRWISETIVVEEKSRPARKKQHVVDWVGATALPVDIADLTSTTPPPLPPDRFSIESVPNKPEDIIAPAEVSFTPAALRRRATRTEAERNDAKGSTWRSSALAPPPPLQDSGPAVKTATPSSAPLPPPGILLPAEAPPLPPLSMVREIEQTSVTTETHGPFVPYLPVKARSSIAAQNDASFVTEQVRAYIESLQIPKSTLEELDHYLSRPSRGKATTWDPFRALFRAIHDDTHSLVEVVRTSLRRIREGTLDEELLQKRVNFWRGLHHRLSHNLADLDQNLRSFVQSVYEADVKTREFDSPSEALAKEARQALKDCIMLIDRSSQSLLAEMQIVDSRRSIAEAESVSKLTELAFVFIPLSFVASLFSMQIHELEGGAPAYQFVLVALGFVVMAYAVRLSIRSSHVIDYKNRVFVQIRKESKLQFNEPIPTHTFFGWVCLNFGGAMLKSSINFITVFAPLTLVLAVIAAILSPIVLLWLRGIDKGFSAVITVILLLLDAVLIAPIVSGATGKLDINPRKRIGEIRHRHHIKSRRRRLRRAGILSDTADESGTESDDDNIDAR